MDPLRTARQLIERVGYEAAHAATVLRARGPGVVSTPPHGVAEALRDLAAYGPIAGAFTLAAAGFADRPAIIDELGTITFGDLDQRTNLLANALHGRGFAAGDGLGILCRNHRYLYESVLAGAKLGARTLLLNTDFAGPQLADVCAREGVAVLFHDAEFGAVADAVAPALGKYLAWVDDRPENDEGTLGALISTARDARLPRPRRQQRIVLLTSGTTGVPKGAPRDIGLSLALPGGYLAKIPLRSGRTVVLAAPAFHAWGLASSMIALGLGNTVVLARRSDPHFVLAALEHHRADALFTVPILLARLLDLGTDHIRSHDLSALRIVAVSGSALSPDLATRTMDVLGDVLYNLYGSTEVAYAAIATPADLRAAPGTVGRPPPGSRVRLLDDLDREVPAEQTGRIFVGNAVQFEGYTGGGSKQVVDGLMATGDVGHLDASGRLFVDGRDDDMIVSGGENVYPAEVEELLSARSDVREAAVIGVPDPDFGNRLRAYVVLIPGAYVDEQTLRGYVRDNLARYKVPREIVFVDALPRNPAGKIIKRDLSHP